MNRVDNSKPILLPVAQTSGLKGSCALVPSALGNKIENIVIPSLDVFAEGLQHELNSYLQYEFSSSSKKRDD